MIHIQKTFLALMLSITLPLLIGQTHPVYAASAEVLDEKSQNALKTLYQHNATAEELSHTAKAILVFPTVVKAGFGLGVSYGEGELIKDSKVESYYSSLSGSCGLQIGAQTYGYAIFFMNDEALNHLNDAQQWEIGVDPTIAVATIGAAKHFSTLTLQKDAYAFIFNQKGIMAGFNLEGTKIYPIER
jgi:lipid-binding SYLF domain-containing protein